LKYPIQAIDFSQQFFLLDLPPDGGSRMAFWPTP
jgi:hypothetical protein